MSREITGGSINLKVIVGPSETKQAIRGRVALSQGCNRRQSLYAQVDDSGIPTWRVARPSADGSGEQNGVVETPARTLHALHGYGATGEQPKSGDHSRLRSSTSWPGETIAVTGPEFDAVEIQCQNMQASGLLFGGYKRR
ncbi:hypothetical protein HBH98_099510 [Parastagonospora nodorum]|nr:hypothetical protein HBH52_126280 [Parastagonospora nodorum]KAH3999201.1 hypothetical protein HBI10_119850 [Parastagonospora nodorum]KAH4049290.1 hypothetical protein HBH49_144710 [Parastagonospora nodorum]KAH4081228.1 hypothetical protein HBH46_227790 [Parastagonospora nodorum]KAH4206303.1 hypothetical protein HBI95_126650 [Parastagonospora nodorum]